MIKRLLFLGMLLAGMVLAIGCGAPSNEYETRGKYVYDPTNRLSTEAMLSLSARMWQVDTKTDYEIVVVLPDKVLLEDEIIAQFNQMSIGKKDKNNGAGVFVFPDNTWFVSIGTRNDAISVPFSKTEGDKILTKDNLKNDLALSLIRFVERLRTQIEYTSEKEIAPPFWDTLKPLIPMILLCVSFLSLLVFLVQQFNGFQKRDLIAPILILAIFGIFIACSTISENNNPSTYQGYGVVTDTNKTTYHWVETQVYTTTDSNGNTTTHVRHIPHVDYINDTKIADYDLKNYGYEFRTTDNKGAWGIDKGHNLKLTIGINTGKLYSTGGFSDKSGGTTIGDGAKSN